MLDSSCLVVLGSAFGDEGKAKIVDHLSGNFDYVVRYQGGNNAGHTVYLRKDVKHVFRLIPSGITQTTAIVAQGTVVDPERLVEEMDACRHIVPLENRLFISDKAHVIFEWSRILDHLIDQLRGENKVGTTGNGIGPAYALKALRLNARVQDLMDREALRKNLSHTLKFINPLLKSFGHQEFDLEQSVEKYWNLGQRLKPYVLNTMDLLQEAARNKKKLLFEGSQGLLLDLDMGTYPFVTSSNVIGNLTSGTGLPMSVFQGNLMGLVKCYFSRVGEGEFPTELQDPELTNLIRTKGKEIGAATGRPRRIGWLDLVCLRYMAAFSGMDKVALTLVDVLNDLPEVKVCVDYLDKDGKSVGWEHRNQGITPIYKVFRGWKDDYSKVKKFSDFSEELRNFIGFIEEYLNVKVAMVSYGPLRSNMLIRND